MKIQLQTEKVELSSGQSQYLTSKIESLEKYHEKITTDPVSVKITVEKNETTDRKRPFIIKATMTVPKAMFRAEARAFTIEEGTDLIHDKFYRQIDRYKTKHLKKPELLNSDEVASLATEPISEADPRISKRKLFSDLIPMSVSEAIDTMAMLGHTFFVFVNIETDRYNIVYQRTDNKTYGLVELEHQEGVTN